jgi:hypothetical protein
MSDVTDIDFGYKAILRAIFGMEKGTTLTVGIHEGLEGEGGGDTEGRDPDSIAAYAAANEFGTETIPARPWMRTAIDGNVDKYKALVKRAMERALTKGLSPVVTLANVGRVVRNDLIRSIKGGSWEENAPATKARKGSSKPLVDTGAMQRAITFKVEKK